MIVTIKNNNKCETFVNIFQHLKLFSQNVNLTFSEEKLFMQGMDSSHVSIFELQIMSDWFDVFEVAESATIGINSSTLFRIMNTRTACQVIYLDIRDDDFHIELKNEKESKDDFNKYFKIPLMDLDSEMMHIPKTDYDLQMTLSSKKFKTLIDQLADFGDTIDVIYSDDNIYLKSTSIEEGTMKTEIKLDDLEECEVVEDMALLASFATRYLKNMTQFQKIADNITIGISNDIPIKISYIINTEDADNNYLSFFLAPKLQD